MANVRVTKKDMFNEILNNYDLTEAQRDFINHEIELLDKKSAGNRKPTKTQIANEGIKVTILNGMDVDERYTVTEVIKSNADLAEYSNQKISALMSQLVADNKVVRSTEKGKTYFSLAD